MMRCAYFVWGILLCAVTASAQHDLVITELNYNPIDDGVTEFVELYNPTDDSIDLSQYRFTDGIYYTFPPNASIAPSEYVLIVRYTNAPTWQNATYQIFGPYIDDLDDRGELVRLRASDGRVVDEVAYDDELPWARGADGYGPSLERIHHRLQSDDYHSWRASLNVGRSITRTGGTPGAVNSIIAVPPKPSVVSWEFDPLHPTSSDSVLTKISLDGTDKISDVTLRVIALAGSTVGNVETYPMNLDGIDDDIAHFSVRIPARASQTLVRAAIEISLSSIGTLYLPHSAEPRPFESYFVYDREIPSLLPIMWTFHRATMDLQAPSKSVSGVVIKPVDGDAALVFDGAVIEGSRNGQKIRFLKHEEFDGNRTLNMLPERPSGGTTSGEQAPHVEHFSHQIFRDFGVMAPLCYWFRVIERNRPTRRLLIQQPNEKFLEYNGRDSSGNVYKIAYNESGGFAKMTNTNEGSDDYLQLLSRLNEGGESERRAAIYRYLDAERVMAYSVAGVLMSNWDGFFNNMFLYHDPSTDRWECIPWDLDKTFGYTDGDHMFVEMPPNFPLDGQARQAARQPGPISRPFHNVEDVHEEYIYKLREGLDGLFARDRIEAMMQEIETLLLDDLKLQEEYTGETDSSSRSQVINSYDVMKTFVRLRREYLDAVLPEPVSVSDWPVY